MARPGPHAELRRHGGLGRYLLDGERIVTANHQHWAKIAAPVASAVAGLVLVLVLDSSLPASLGLVANLLWWAWFALAGRAIWRVLERRHDWFVATDKRLILTYGLITQKVAMMPLAKVTDMSYNRSPLGRLLGYGTFVMESAGQDQALHTVGWVADPDHTYRVICAEMFGVDAHEVDAAPGRSEVRHDHRFGGGPPLHTPVPYTESAPAPQGSDPADYSTGIRIRPPKSGQADNDSFRTDSALPDPGIHEADTGPIPTWPPSGDRGGHSDRDGHSDRGH
jgi:membrane protein YdbS with pleckstrin-like domain